jgi:hypothetical protein
MLERLAAALRRMDEHAQIFPRRLLADELVEALRAKRRVGILGRPLGRGDSGRVRCHQTFAKFTNVTWSVAIFRELSAVPGAVVEMSEAEPIGIVP